MFKSSSVKEAIKKQTENTHFNPVGFNKSVNNLEVFDITTFIRLLYDTKSTNAKIFACLLRFNNDYCNL
jgi:hypothetical protein